MNWTEARTSIIAAPAPKPEDWTILVIAGVMFLTVILVSVAFVRLFNLWLRAFLARANISLLSLISMKLRHSPIKAIVRWKIMAAQAGVTISTQQLESAALQGVDVERAVLVMIRARQTGQEIEWSDVIARDTDERLNERP